MKTFYPIITTPMLAECRDFYVHVLGAKVLFQKDWYVHLVIEGGEIGFLHPKRPARLPVFQHATLTRGMCLALEVKDVRRLHDDLQANNVKIFGALQEYPGGELAFSLLDPTGTVINIVECIEDAPVVPDVLEI
ncbi:MAG: VOC family protein [Stenotrophobium sp.]